MWHYCLGVVTNLGLKCCAYRLTSAMPLDSPDTVDNYVEESEGDEENPDNTEDWKVGLL